MKARHHPHLGVVMLITAIVPPLAAQFEFGTATGVVAIAAFALMNTLMRGPRGRSSPAPSQHKVWLSLTFIYLLASGYVSWKTDAAFDAGRFVQSLLFMAFCLTGAYHFSSRLRSSSDERADSAFRFVFMIILCSSLGKVLGIHLAGNHRSVFFYNEPSHYAVGIAPFLLYMVVTDVRRRWLWMALGVAVALAIQNLTMLVASALIFVVVMRVSWMTILFTALVFVLAMTMGDALSYYTDRAALSSESTNLSNLVYLSGWERAQLSLEDTRGLGYGLNQLGIVGDQGSIMLILSTLNAEGLNALDGGAVASKLLAEFGAMGVVLLLLYARYFLKGARLLRSAAHKQAALSRVDVFFWSCFVMYSVDLFVRGSGYFTAESFMFFAAIWGLARRSRQRRAAHRRNPGPLAVNGSTAVLPSPAH